MVVGLAPASGLDSLGVTAGAFSIVREVGKRGWCAFAAFGSCLDCRIHGGAVGKQVVQVMVKNVPNRRQIYLLVSMYQNVSEACHGRE